MRHLLRTPVRPLVSALALTLAPASASAQPGSVQGARPSPPSAPAPVKLVEGPALVGAAPKGIDEAMARVSPERLRADINRLAAFGTRHTMSDTASETRGIGAARRWIKSEFEHAAAASGREGPLAPRVFFDSYLQTADGRRITKDTELVNVVIELPGTLGDRAERIYLLGHYDSRATDVLAPDAPAPGSNDDGSGTALVLELARVLCRERPRHTIVLVATAGEEQGLLGARHAAQRAAEAGERIRAVLNNDIVGDPTSPTGQPQDGLIRVFSDGLMAGAAPSGERGGTQLLERLRRESALTESPSRQLARFVNDVGLLHEKLPVKAMLVFRPDRFLRSGDHIPFHEAGFPAVRFTEVEEEYNRQHQDPRTENGVRYGDDPQFVDEKYLAGVAMLNGAAAMHLAMGPGAPQHVRIITANLGNTTTLRWDAPADSELLSGYEIVWRDTTAGLWQHAASIGTATEATLPLGKDNVYFGVRAVDSRGLRSPVVFPLAAGE